MQVEDGKLLEAEDQVKRPFGEMYGPRSSSCTSKSRLENFWRLKIR